MSATNVKSVLSAMEQHVDLAHDAPFRSWVVDPSIDDPVNDTGLGPRRGDLQLSDEFACLVKLICEEGGEFS